MFHKVRYNYQGEDYFLFRFALLFFMLWQILMTKTLFPSVCSQYVCTPCTCRLMTYSLLSPWLYTFPPLPIPYFLGNGQNGNEIILQRLWWSWRQDYCHDVMMIMLFDCVTTFLRWQGTIVSGGGAFGINLIFKIKMIKIQLSLSIVSILRQHRCTISERLQKAK